MIWRFLSYRADNLNDKVEKTVCYYLKPQYFCRAKCVLFNWFKSTVTMKKVFMTVAVVAMMFAVAACGNKGQKAEATVEETVEETIEEVADSTEAAIDSLAAAAEEIAEEVVAD